MKVNINKKKWTLEAFIIHTESMEAMKEKLLVERDMTLYRSWNRTRKGILRKLRIW